MNFLRKRPFIFLFIVLLMSLAIFSFVKNKRLSDELKVIKQENEELAQVNMKIKEQQSLIEDKDELYAKLAAELHKVRKELEEEKGKKKGR